MDVPEELSREELDAQDGQAVPDREAMSDLDRADICRHRQLRDADQRGDRDQQRVTRSVADADADQTVIIGQFDQDPASDPARMTPNRRAGAEQEEA